MEWPKNLKKKKGASVCSSSSDAELLSLPGSVQLWERQMLHDWCLAPRKSILQRGNPGPATAVGLLPCVARKKRLKDSGLEFLAAEKCRGWAKGAHIAVLRGKQPWESWLPVPWRWIWGDHRENRNAQGDTLTSDPTTLVHVSHPGSTSPFSSWSNKIFHKNPLHSCNLLPPQHHYWSSPCTNYTHNTTQSFHPKNPSLFFPTHP